MATLNIRDIPEDVRNKFKALCAVEGDTMTKVLIEFMKSCIEAGKLPD